MMEIDLLAVAEGEVLIGEAKSKVGADKVRAFREAMARFGEFFPEHAGCRVHLMIASIAFDPSVVVHMTAQRVLALGFGSETMDLLNPEAIAG